MIRGRLTAEQEERGYAGRAPVAGETLIAATRQTQSEAGCATGGRVPVIRRRAGTGGRDKLGQRETETLAGSPVCPPTAGIYRAARAQLVRWWQAMKAAPDRSFEAEACLQKR